MKYYNVELATHEAMALKLFLRTNGFTFETSACFDSVHFEVLASQEQKDMINSFLDTLYL